MTGYQSQKQFHTLSQTPAKTHARTEKKTKWAMSYYRLEKVKTTATWSECLRHLTQNAETARQ